MRISNIQLPISNNEKGSVGSKGGKATRSTGSGSAMTMAELMAKTPSSIRSFKKGELVTGTVSKLTSSEILVDIGAKTEAVVLEKEKSLLNSLLAALKVGDTVTVSVLNPESDQGNPVVSLRRFMDEKVWAVLEKLKNDETPIEITINDLTKGGFLATTPEGVAGFLPNSQTILNDNPQSFVGKKIKAQVLELNRALHKIIFSQKAALGDEDFSRSTSAVKTGEIVDTVVSSTTPFGIFVSVKSPSAGSGQALEGFIHLSELSWDKTETAQDYFKVGETVKAQVLGIDRDAKRVNLSVKRMTKDPFVQIAERFTVDKKVNGTVIQTSSLGIVVDLGEGIEGLIKKEKIAPSAKFASGDSIEATVSEVDIKRHKVILVPVLKEKPIGYR